MSAPTLPSFMERAMAFFGKAEANHTAAESLATANARIVALESEIVQLKFAADACEATLIKFTEGVETVKAALVAKELEVTNLKAELVTAKGTANAVIASQGLGAEQLPPLAPRATGSGDKTLDLDERCLAAHAKRNGNGHAGN